MSTEPIETGLGATRAAAASVAVFGFEALATLVSPCWPKIGPRGWRRPPGKGPSPRLLDSVGTSIPLRERTAQLRPGTVEGQGASLAPRAGRPTDPSGASGSVAKTRDRSLERLGSTASGGPARCESGGSELEAIGIVGGNLPRLRESVKPNRRIADGLEAQEIGSGQIPVWSADDSKSKELVGARQMVRELGSLFSVAQPFTAFSVAQPFTLFP